MTEQEVSHVCSGNYGCIDLVVDVRERRHHLAEVLMVSSKELGIGRDGVRPATGIVEDTIQSDLE